MKPEDLKGSQPLICESHASPDPRLRIKASGARKILKFEIFEV
jgi:hypothetical protein